MKYQLVQPQIDENEIDAVKKVLNSGMLVEGQVARQLELEFARYVNVRHAITAASGTAALHLVWEALGLPVGAEVITSAFTFIASANSIAMVGGIPIFADIDPETYNLDPESVRKHITERTKAIMPVHIFGLPADMKAFRELADEHNLLLIEDAAQAHGGRMNGQHVGTFGVAGCFSFYATKNMISGEGGIITTDDDELAEKIRSVKNHGRGREGGYHHYRVGYNYRTTDMAAAIALAQLHKLPAMVKQRQANFRVIRDMLEPYDDFIRFQIIPNGYEHGSYICAPVLENEKIQVSDVITELKKKGIASRTIYSIPVYRQPAYQNIPLWRWARCVKYPDYSKVLLPNTERIARTHFELPIHPGITEEDSKEVATVLIDILKSLAA